MRDRDMVCIGLLTLVFIGALLFATNRNVAVSPLAGQTVTASEGPPAFVRSLRPSYLYSIIPGGAYSKSELQFASSIDPVVKAHYGDFDIRNAKLVRLTVAREQYVSYRIKDQVYWTKTRLRISKGELLLTDGVQFVRARCGNRLSNHPRGCSSVSEPGVALSVPSITLDTLAQFAFATPPEVSVIPANLSAAEPILPTVNALLSSEGPADVRPGRDQSSVTGASSAPHDQFSLSDAGLAWGGLAPLAYSASIVEPSGLVLLGALAPSTTPEPSSLGYFLIACLFAGWACCRRKCGKA